ncbi:GNAT family N-acetyltransferase [Christiangramia sediminis]|uniref:N-acetyltransferase n=1 Tax=Christiangramia sediminis TaxID=2881336 RepID=A0A9X1LGD4_9FLAO|nr:GNAT family N-acetyltransferase [Christiangramia sediminis]MCB7479789.1 N-acetyltransferase [Christiangramia sediminis]
MPYTLHQNVEKNRFEVTHQDLVAFVDYKLHKDEISFIHTEVPRELSGKGIGSFLAKNVLEYAKDKHLKVKPYCPFIKAYIDKHEEYQAISLFHEN